MSGKTRITVLVENTARGLHVLGEHGLAYWIEMDDHCVLFDTGQGRVLAENAATLGVDLDRAESIALSHGHYDHTGGLTDALRGESPKTVLLHPAALDPKYARNFDGTSREIGLPDVSRRAIESADRVIHAMEPVPLAGNLNLTGPVPRITDFEDTGGPFFLDEDCRKADPLEDDQSLFFDTSKGTVVVLGCAHSGVINTLEHIGRLTDGRPLHAVIGGMHLVHASAERIERTVEALRRFDPQLLAPAHCTGTAATVALWQAFPGHCTDCSVGTRFQFE
jgi:7,8-dihydropterin-6-yl-methyl-4-(beta-D-ribofuranosyl)aminobenzene 5'-phosphate synthase